VNICYGKILLKYSHIPTPLEKFQLSTMLLMESLRLPGLFSEVLPAVSLR
jgi:hypothetical protein